MKRLGTVYAREHGLHDWKGEDISEFPADLHVRQFPIGNRNDTTTKEEERSGIHV